MRHRAQPQPCRGSGPTALFLHPQQWWQQRTTTQRSAVTSLPTRIISSSPCNNPISAAGCQTANNQCRLSDGRTCSQPGSGLLWRAAYPDRLLQATNTCRNATWFPLYRVGAGPDLTCKFALTSILELKLTLINTFTVITTVVHAGELASSSSHGSVKVTQEKV